MESIEPVIQTEERNDHAEEELRVTHISLNTSPTVGDTHGFIVGVRVVPDGRDGSVVFGRTLGIDEPDSSDPIILRPRQGETLKFRTGAIRITLHQLDEYARSHGYPALTRSLWAWFGFGLPVSEEVIRYSMAAARRLDVSTHLHDRIDGILESLDDPEVTGIPRQALFFEVVGSVEVFVIALHRALRMISGVSDLFAAPLAVPAVISETLDRVTALRHAYEHVEDRALGMVHGKPHPDALTGFDFTDFFTDRRIRFGDHQLVIGTETRELLSSARTHLANVVAARAGEARINSGDITFFETGRNS